MYKTHLLVAVLTVTLKYSSPAGMDENDVRAPFGPKMCVEWCHSLRKCHSPIFVMRDLSCHAGKYNHRPLNSTGTYTLSVNKPFLGICSRQAKTIKTRRSRFVTVPDGTKSNTNTSIFLLNNGKLNVYEQRVHSWRPIGPKRRFHQITDGGTQMRVYCLTTDGQRYNISYCNVNNPKEAPTVLAEGIMGSNVVEFAVDDGAGLIFVLSMTSETDMNRVCKLFVFKNKGILSTVLLVMYLYGSTALNRVHRKLYIPYNYGSSTYVGEVDYKGWVCNKIAMLGQEPMALAYDDRDDVVYVMVADVGIKYVYTLNFTEGSKRKEMTIPRTYQPQIVLISCNTLVLIGRTKGEIHDRNCRGKVTEIDGSKAVSGVIIEHT